MSFDKRIFIATDVAFWRRELGSEERIYRLVRAITDSGASVCLFFVGALSEKDRDEIGDLPLLHWRVVDDGRSLTISDLASLRGLRFFSKWVRKIVYRELLGGVRLPFFRSARVGKAFKDFVDFSKPQVLVVEFVRMTYLLDWCPIGLSMKKFLDTHDLMSQRYLSFKRAGLRHWIKITEDEEAEAFSRFDSIIAIQPEEKARILKMIPGGNVFCSGLDSPVTVREPSIPSEFTLGFLGGNNQVNRESLRWFLDRVWPKLQNIFPEISFFVGGGVSVEVKATDKCVKPLGYLSDLKLFFSQINLLVNPVQAGGGIKVKNIDALAGGVPVLTTPCGAEGFPVHKGIGVLLVSRCEEEFFEAILNLFRSPSQLFELQQQASQFAQEYLTREAAYGELFRAWGLWT